MSYSKKIWKFGFIFFLIVVYMSLNGCATTKLGTSSSLLDDPILSLDLDSLLYVEPDTIVVEGEKFNSEREIIKGGVTIIQKQKGESLASVTSDGKLIIKKEFYQEEEQIIDMKQMVPQEGEGEGLMPLPLPEEEAPNDLNKNNYIENGLSSKKDKGV